MEDTVDPRWRKSTRSSGNGGACVEVGASSACAVLVRDTASRNGATLTFASEAWRGFITGLKTA
jgi:hypothetical protein